MSGTPDASRTYGKSPGVPTKSWRMEDTVTRLPPGDLGSKGETGGKKGRNSREGNTNGESFIGELLSVMTVYSKWNR